eukprot:CAMPEP_0206531394 /NCGR_PEP_ID=MMETSP0325_2-20121206/3735_1 /ASSEMBLY_ACC=CAM_ASM_000347 /TAXON_ID=2866 /ORGANISM="Crypthecodinium cohnii, Strain Seligo" /LENGTH=525 /DNA_ID=CAMNT_0054027621 /DNA_START=70 /DNA_END=1647 /DNA_ORIENTATION=+
MTVLSTLLFEQPPAQNFIVNGLVLAADGKKMSKRLKNYPDPQEIVQAHGADAVRMYLCNSPVVRAEPLRFKAEGVRDVVKDVFLPWYNAYRFLVQEVTRYEASSGQRFLQSSPGIDGKLPSQNTMDRWILSENHALLTFVREEIEAYRLYTVVPRLLAFLDDLTNRYVRLNRDRMRGVQGREEAEHALETLYTVLLNVTVMLAPVTPFLSELLYQNLARALPESSGLKAASVHFVMIPEPSPEAFDPESSRAVQSLQAVMELGRSCREKRKIGLKVPIREMVVVSASPQLLADVQLLEDYIRDELNIMNVEFRDADADDGTKLELVPVLNFKVLGKQLGKDMKKVQNAVKDLSQDELLTFERSGSIELCGHSISSEGITLQRQVVDLEAKHLEVAGATDVAVIVDFTADEELMQLAMAREVSNRIQRLRKSAGLHPQDPIKVQIGVSPEASESPDILKALQSREADIARMTRCPIQIVDFAIQGASSDSAQVLGEDAFKPELGASSTSKQGANSVSVHVTILREL